MSDEMRSLASSMTERKRAGASPYIVFLGAGASTSSGCSGMVRIIDDVLSSRESTQFRDWQRKIDEATSASVEYGELLREKINRQKLNCFFEVWNRLDRTSRYTILRKHLWEGKSPSSGYIDLAHLIRDGYVKMVITTNLDNLLEKALSNVGWYPPDNFIVITNRKDKPEEIREQLESSRAPFKVVKLHGTLESPESYAFTPDEVFDFEKIIKPSLSRIVNQSLIVIGHSMQDRDIDMLFEDEGKEIHFVNPSRPETGSRIDTILKVRRQGSVIEGDEAKFDNFLRELRACVERKLGEASKPDLSPSIEGFLRNIGYDHELEVPRSRFRNLPALYVKPTEYDDICSKLEREHVIFIIGEPHLGKTYTALHILWEYYRRNYEVIHIKHDRFVTLLHQHNGNMKELLLDLFANEKGLPRIIHFDDPFGETMERRTDVFAKELDTFLSLAHGYEHLRVVVTTRLNIFRESMAEIHDIKKIEELEKDIRVHTSYHSDTLLEVLHRYTCFYKPLWANEKKITTALDERLPDLLPAPHNIEFFVRTSENLASLDEVFRHIDECKEMVTALGEWMGTLSDHEQIFLLWLEICSTASILFPGTSASKMDFERIYVETLAYLFRKKHISGIPTSPFSRARDKFDVIVLESRDKDAGTVKLDFVHPAYHEAFWYAIRHTSTFNAWWELIETKVGSILWNLGRSIDIVQLRMIRRYGIVNRNLDQLLLISAESEDLNEQIIALEHMLERREQFENVPQFAHCYNSIVLSTSVKHKLAMLKLVEKYSYKLPLDFLAVITRLAIDQDLAVRQEFQRSISRHLDMIPESIRRSEPLRILFAAKELLSILRFQRTRYLPRNEDVFVQIVVRISAFLLEGTAVHRRYRKRLASSLEKLSTEDFQQLFKVPSNLYVPPYYSPRRPFSFPAAIAALSLLEYDLLSEKKREVLLGLKSSPEVLAGCRNALTMIVEANPVSTAAVLLAFPDHKVQYRALREILTRFKELSNEEGNVVNRLIDDPHDTWVGGSIGFITRKDLEPKLSTEVKGMPLKLAKHPSKQIVGALLAEMVENHCGQKGIALQEMYEATLYELSRDPEVVRYAEAWMDYELDSLDFFDKEYWTIVKTHLRTLKSL